MRVKPWPQLDELALRLLAQRVAELGGSKAAVARELEVGRTAVSQALAGRYPGDTRRLRAKIVARYADGIACPHLGRRIPPAECQAHRSRPLAASSGSREAVKFWQACRACAENPSVRLTEAAS